MALIAQFLCPVIHGQWEQFDFPDHRDFPVVIRQRRKALAQIIPVTATCGHISGSLKTLPIFLAKPIRIQFAAAPSCIPGIVHCPQSLHRRHNTGTTQCPRSSSCSHCATSFPANMPPQSKQPQRAGLFDHGSVMRGLAVQLVFIVGFHGRNPQRRIIRKNAWTSHDSAP